MNLKKILDGKGSYVVCMDYGFNVKTEYFDNEQDAVEFAQKQSYLYDSVYVKFDGAVIWKNGSYLSGKEQILNGLSVGNVISEPRDSDYTRCFDELNSFAESLSVGDVAYNGLDLYLRRFSEVSEFLMYLGDKYKNVGLNKRLFKNNVEGDVWYEIPFMNGLSDEKKRAIDDYAKKLK